MKIKFKLITALLPVLALTACFDDSESEQKKQEGASSAYQKTVEENQATEQQAKLDRIRQVMRNGKQPELKNPNKSNGFTEGMKP